MSLSITFRHAARVEIFETAARYEARQKKLGEEFLLEIQRCLSLAAEQPRMYAAVHRDIRRVSLRRFPFSIYFRIKPDSLVVIAVFHGKRAPTIWRKRT